MMITVYGKLMAGIALMSLLICACNGIAGQLDWPDAWAAFGPVPPAGDMLAPGGLPSVDNLAPGGRLQKIPDKIKIDGIDYPRRLINLASGDLVDLAAIFGDVKRGVTVYLMAPVKIVESGTYRIHTGANWWMHWWVDGRPVFSTIPEGNKKSPVFITNHVFSVDLAAGEHVLAAAVIAGGGGFSFAAGGDREADMAARIAAAPPADFRSAYKQAEKVIESSRARSGIVAGRPIDFEEVRAVLRNALALAKTDYERALALLDIADSKLNDLAWADYESARADYSAVLESKALPDQRACAAIGIGEIFLNANDYANAREYFDKADTLSTDPVIRAESRFARARSFLWERDYAAALAEYGRLDTTNDVPAAIMLEARAHAAGIKLMPLVRSEHPRLFFNADTWPAVKARALGVQKEAFEQIQREIDLVALSDIITADWGMHAMQAAFIARVTGDEAVLDKTRKMLRATLDEWLRGGGDTRFYSRVAFAAALDWVWNDLPPGERLALTRDFIRYTGIIYTGEKLRGQLHKVGYYYLRNMFFYAGLAVLHPDLDDMELAQAVAALGQGFAHNWELWNKQPEFAMDDGGSGPFAVGRLGYEYADAPTPAWTYMHCMQSALDEPVPAEWAYLGITPHHVLRNVLGITPAGFKQFGFSKDWHKRGGTVRADLLYDHLGQFIHFFGKSHPQEAGIAVYLRRRLAAEGRPGAGEFFVYPFLLNLEDAPPADIPDNMPLARNFEGRGVMLMSSGFGSNDTFVLFSSGGGKYFGGHHDAGHFSIYRNGYLALDTGSRAHSYGKVSDGPTFYFAQTIAHNCVLVRNPQRQIRWDGEMLEHTGGQDRGREFARVLAFESRPEYVYAAVDLTPTYNTNECPQNIRQFVFLPPTHIVVFDRVTSQKPEYEKIWLFHTANEPVLHVSPRTFHAEQGLGKIFCRTLYPADAILTKIGGPGKEFWASGRNWGLTKESKYLRDLGMASADDVPEFQGRWRVEVRPGAARTVDCFLHLIETGDANMSAMTDADMRDSDAGLELRFQSAERKYVLLFNKTGAVGGHVVVMDKDAALIDHELAMTVMPQSGMALEGQPVWGTEHAMAIALERLRNPYLLTELQNNPRSEAAIHLRTADMAAGGLIADLSDPWPRVRRYAAWVLGEIGDANAVAGLASLLDDRQFGISAAAFDALAKIGAAAPAGNAVRALGAALNDASPVIRVGAADALGRTGAASGVTPLIKALDEDADPEVRAAAAVALGVLKAPEAIMPLIAALNDQDWRVRRQATAALAAIGAPAVPALIEALAVPDEPVQAMAVEALLGIGAPAYEFLLAVFQSDNPIVRGHAAAALRPPPGDSRALRPLLALARDQDLFVRVRAVRALGRVGGEEATVAVTKALADTAPSVRAAAAAACGELRAAAASDILVAALKDADAEVRRNAAVALGQIQNPGAIEPLMDALQDADVGVRVNAAGALGGLAASNAVPALIAAMSDKQHAVGYAANDSLCRITGHTVEIPLGWDGATIRQYRKPLWEQWLADRQTRRE